jgi:WD40 repeat protein
VLVTSALLPEVDESDKEKERTWEFCKWSLNTGKMLDRWTRKSETEQQISLLKSGELILYASNKETIVEEARHDGTVRYRDKDLSSFFAVENPKQKNFSMLVKRSGATRIFDASQSDGGLNTPGHRINYDADDNYQLLSFDDYPLAGEWSPNGDRFYMVWTSGRINELVWESGRLSRGRDLQDIDLKKLKISLSRDGEGNAGAVRLASRWQLDLKVRNQAGTNLLYLAVRLPGTEGRTRLVRVAFPPKGKGEVLASKSEEALRRHRFVLTDSNAPEVEITPLKALPRSVGEIVATRTVGKTSFCATADGTVYRISENNLTTVFGRPETLAGTGNSSADKVVTLHRGGVMWRGDLTQGTWEWTQLTATVEGASDVKMSPDGIRLLISVTTPTGERSMLVTDTESGKVLETIEQAQCGAWNAESELALVRNDGAVETRTAGGVQTVGKLGANEPARSIHYFTEPWSDVNQKPTRWLAVHTQPTDDDGKLNYFGLDADNNTQHSAALASGTKVLACSPTDGILVTGGAGVVGIHFASPTLGELGKLLFTLEGHAGAEIKCLKFSPDGTTLITTDDRNRLFGWLSKDNLGGVSEMPDFKTVKQPIQ